MSVHKALIDKRLVASKASKGTSSDPIYRTFEQAFIELKLKGDLLDFGAGTGNLTRRLHAMGYFGSITAIDIMQRPVNLDASITWISQDLNEVTNLRDQTFDVVVSAEIIEHLENSRAVSREWFRLLRPGGTVILSTPNNESWRSLAALLIQGHFVAFGDNCYPAHITALLRKDLERILSEAGFTQPKFMFTNVGCIPKLPTLDWQAISATLFRGLRFSDNLLAIAHKPSETTAQNEGTNRQSV